MTNPSTTPVTYGGLVFDPTCVKTRRYNEKSGTYTIEFKSGDILTYPMQKIENGKFAEVECEIVDDALFIDDTYYNISNVMGATFTSSNRSRSHVTLQDCENTNVDLATEQSFSDADSVVMQGGHNNRANLDDEDSACIEQRTIKKTVYVNGTKSNTQKVTTNKTQIIGPDIISQEDYPHDDVIITKRVDDVHTGPVR